MNKETITKFIIYFLIPLQLLFFTFLVPPFQKPDEQPHFEKSLLISKGYLFCQKKSNNTVSLEKKYIDFIKSPYLDLMTHGRSSKLPLPIFLKDLFSNNQSNKKIDFNIDHLCSFPIISYLPQAFALLITSIFKLSPILSLYFGRLAISILGYFWFLYLFRKIVDEYKLILLFTFALPMTLHQISSFSYDMLHIMLALTFFTLIINNLEESFPPPIGVEGRLRRESKRSWIPSYEGMTNKINIKYHETKKYFKLFFVLFLFLSSKKIGYETFFLFLFLIPFEIKPMIISSLIFIPFYFLSKFTGFYDLQSSLFNQVINPIHQLNFLLSNPINIIKVVVITTIHRLSFYLQSLIGIFGWLEYGLDPLSYFLYGLFFIYVLTNVETRHALSLQKNKSILLFFALIISYIFIVLLAYVFNTVPGTFTAHGVQGRYFIPFLPFIILFIIQIKNNPIFKKILYFSIIIYLIFSTFHSVYTRYY